MSKHNNTHTGTILQHETCEQYVALCRQQLAEGRRPVCLIFSDLEGTNGALITDANCPPQLIVGLRYMLRIVYGVEFTEPVSEAVN